MYLGLSPKGLQFFQGALSQRMLGQFLYGTEAVDEFITSPCEGLLAVQPKKTPSFYCGE